MVDSLDLTKRKAKLFKPTTAMNISHCDNLFVITHLGQLKQIEALISRKTIKNNGLVVLYTEANLTVPQSVNDQFSDALFEQVLFLEIPFGINKSNLKKLKLVHKLYTNLLMSLEPKALYLNSFEGHYAVLIAIARSIQSEIVLVEEGTATYKFNIAKNNELAVNESIDYQFFRKRFTQTVGSTQIAKKIIKNTRYIKDFGYQFYNFGKQVKNDPIIQEGMIRTFGNKNLNAYFEPFRDFDKAYVSFPHLIDESFNVDKSEYFSLYNDISDEDKALAQAMVDKYQVTTNDVLYVSQRYFLDPKQYVQTVSSIIMRMVDTSQRIFVKLHPKESDRVFAAFKELEQVSNGKFVLIDEGKFLIEPFIYISQVSKVFGLTSTTLVYTPLICENTQAVSIAKSLIKYMPRSKGNDKGLLVVKEHLEIIEVFDNIVFC